MTNTRDPAQPDSLVGQRVQPDCPLSGEVKRGGTTTQIYFVRAVTLGLIKIGKTACAIKRMESLRGSSPDRLELMGIMLCDQGGALEGRLHARFATERAHGEWFRPSTDLIDFIAANCREPRPRKKPTLRERRDRAELRRAARRATLARTALRKWEDEHGEAA